MVIQGYIREDIQVHADCNFDHYISVLILIKDDSRRNLTDLPIDLHLSCIF